MCQCPRTKMFPGSKTCMFHSSNSKCVSVPEQKCVNVPRQNCRNVPEQKCQNVPRQVCENKCVDSWWCKQCSHGQTPDFTAAPAIIAVSRKKGRISGFGK